MVFGMCTCIRDKEENDCSEMTSDDAAAVGTAVGAEVDVAATSDCEESFACKMCLVAT
jgi:hypothetical protein